VCASHTCTTCGTPPTDLFYVDPIGGSDKTGNGSATCPFRSITRALAFHEVGGSTSHTEIWLVNDSLSSNPTRGESFPIVVPTQVTITSSSGTLRTIQVPAGRSGFRVAGLNATLQYLLIDGASVGTNGVEVEAGASASVLTSLTVQNFLGDGILVEAGKVTIGGMVYSNHNGASGLHILGGSTTALSDPIGGLSNFDNNGGNGIFVELAGALTLTGTPTLTGFPTTWNPPAVSTGAGSLTSNGNGLAGLAIAQTGSAPPLCTITGLVTWGNKGNGMSFTSGSNAAVSGCVSVNNAGAGVRIVAGGDGTTSIPAISASATWAINLSGSSGVGKNLFQAPVNGNGAAGICIDGHFENTAQSLLAKGNYFSNKDCSAAATTPPLALVTSRKNCAKTLDIGIEPTPAGTAQSKVMVGVDNCASF
jgi:hypothetical protein